MKYFLYRAFKIFNRKLLKIVEILRESMRSISLFDPTALISGVISKGTTDNSLMNISQGNNISTSFVV
jgi:hypothetical protein